MFESIIQCVSLWGVQMYSGRVIPLNQFCMLWKQNSLPGAHLFIVQFSVIFGCKKLLRIQFFLNFCLNFCSLQQLLKRANYLKVFSNIILVSYFCKVTPKVVGGCMGTGSFTGVLETAGRMELMSFLFPIFKTRVWYKRCPPELVGGIGHVEGCHGLVPGLPHYTTIISKFIWMVVLFSSYLGKREFPLEFHSFENVQLLAAFCKIRLCPESITNLLNYFRHLTQTRHLVRGEGFRMKVNFLRALGHRLSKRNLSVLRCWMSSCFNVKFLKL